MVGASGFCCATLSRRRMYAAITVVAAWAAFTGASPVFAKSYTLSETADDSRVFRVESKINVNGQLETAAGNNKAVSLKLDVDATHSFLEHRLSAAGKDAEALRSLREYDKAEARIQAGDNIASSRLRDAHKQIVARGKQIGVEFYCPSSLMSNTELELLQSPGDSLAVLGLLPPGDVEIGESWKAESWVIQMLTGTEAVTKSELSCRLQTVTDGRAKVTFEGSIEGATVGAATEIAVVGHYMYDLEHKHIRSLQLKQKEKRSVGAISPGMDVEATINLTRLPTANRGGLTKQALAAVPLEPDASLLMVELELPWGVSVSYDRHWHVFHTTKNAAVLRLLEKGSLVAQCNVTQVEAAQPGDHTPEMRFQNDIRTALGDKLSEIVRAEELKSDDEHYRYRVTAVGGSNGLDMRWIYYLCAAPSGQQAALVFAFESKKEEDLANRDLSIVKSLQFVNAKKPVAAAK